MYEELVKSLRKEAEDTYHFLPKILCLQAADAIETLENTLKIYRESIYSIDNQLPRWISVEERLPGLYEDILVSAKEIPKPIVAWRGSSGFRDALGGYLVVTHWMPLPEPPKEET